MTPRRLSLLVSAAVLAALGGWALAQDRSGPNTDPAAEGGDKGGAVAVLSTAQATYSWGVANGSALAVLAAAEMARSVTPEDVDRKAEQAPIEGAAPGGDTGTGAEVAPPPDAQTMLATARDLAAGDAALEGLVEDVAAASSKGRVGGATRTLSRLPAGHRDTYRVPYYGDQLAEVGVLGDGDADLDMEVTDENGNQICADSSYSDQIYCNWTPKWDGYFYITVKNMGRVRNAYYLLTN